MPQDTEIDWMAVRADYEAGVVKFVDLLDTHKISRNAFYTKAKAEGWPLRTPPRAPRRSGAHATTRGLLIARLFRLLDRQIAQLETDMNDPGEKEVALLGTLTRNLEKLIELDHKEKARSGRPRRRTDIEALRRKLADRIEELRKS